MNLQRLEHLPGPSGKKRGLNLVLTTYQPGKGDAMLMVVLLKYYAVFKYCVNISMHIQILTDMYIYIVYIYVFNTVCIHVYIIIYRYIEYIYMQYIYIYLYTILKNHRR